MLPAEVLRPPPPLTQCEPQLFQPHGCFFFRTENLQSSMLYPKLLRRGDQVTSYIQALALVVICFCGTPEVAKNGVFVIRCKLVLEDGPNYYCRQGAKNFFFSKGSIFQNGAKYKSKQFLVALNIFYCTQWPP